MYYKLLSSNFCLWHNFLWTTFCASIPFVLVCAMLYSLHNGLVLLYKYTSTRASGSVPISVLVQLSSCGVTLRPTVLCTARFRSGVPQHWRSFWPPGAVPPWLTHFGRVRLIAWGLRRPFLRGMPTRPVVFLGLPDAIGLQSCDWIHLKTALCHTRTLGGAYVKYEYTNQRDTITWDTICKVDG